MNNILPDISEDLLNKHKSLKITYDKIIDLNKKLDKTCDEVENELLLNEISNLKLTFNELLQLYDDTNNFNLISEYNNLKKSHDNIVLLNEKLKNENKNFTVNYEDLLNVNIKLANKCLEHENNNNKLIIDYNDLSYNYDDLTDNYDKLIVENKKNKKYYEEQIFNVKSELKNKIKNIRIDNQKLIEKNKELYKLKYQKIIEENEKQNKIFIDDLKNSVKLQVNEEIKSIINTCNCKITAYLIFIFILIIGNIYFIINK
jgi:hypothetical protein